MARPGFLVSGALIILAALWLLTVAVYWFQVVLLFIGLGTLGIGFMDSPGGPVQTSRPPPPSPGPASDLRQQLVELDALLAEGLLKPAEHRRKRQQLLDSWGVPPPPDGRPRQD